MVEYKYQASSPKERGKEMEDWEDYEDESHGMWANENGDPRH